MSTWEKRAGIYMIRNIKNGKVYIGESADLQGRFKQYTWRYTKMTEDAKRGITPDLSKIRPIERIIYQEGWDNFEFRFLEYGKDLFDPVKRSIREMEYIMKYRSIDPNRGYNSTIGGDVRGSNNVRYTQRTPESLNLPPQSRKKNHPVLVYNTVDQQVEVYFFGLKTISKKFKQSKETLRWTIRNGSKALDRYYLFYVDGNMRRITYEFVKATKEQLGFNGGGNSNRALVSLKNYTEAYEIVNHIAEQYGWK